MEKRLLGKTDMRVSVLGFGGAEIGFHQVAAATVERLLSSALDAGLNIIDTAECYMNSEELIGQAVARRRKDFYLFTKCGHADGFDNPDWRGEALMQSIDRSLQRLRVDYVDLVQLHSCSAEILRQGDAIAALQRARDAGKTRYIGYSGDGQDAVYAIKCGAFDTLQTSVSICDQEAFDLTLPLAQAHNIGVIAKRPIANAVWRYADRPENDYILPYWQRLQKLDYDFLKSDDAATIAMRFTLSAAAVATMIVGTTQPDRWLQNAQAISAGPLPAEQLTAIRARWQAVADSSWVGQI
jgi:aryl-alcohol dehydrogenase-like predicted oxidoreductase